MSDDAFFLIAYFDFNLISFFPFILCFYFYFACLFCLLCVFFSRQLLTPFSVWLNLNAVGFVCNLVSVFCSWRMREKKKPQPLVIISSRHFNGILERFDHFQSVNNYRDGKLLAHQKLNQNHFDCQRCHCVRCVCR